MTIAQKVLDFYKSLHIAQPLPEGISVLNPYHDEAAFSYCRKFYNKYYGDERPRQLILGINPGRHGGGLTGVPFTDPVKLEVNCGIPNNLKKQAELSADFIYKVIEAFGGPEAFYGTYLFGAVCPLGFTRDGKNLNYYDVPALLDAVALFIGTCMIAQKEIAGTMDRCICLGEGKNVAFLQRLNQQHAFFREIIALPHPRFIMQYKRKSLDQYLSLYLSLLK